MKHQIMVNNPGCPSGKSKGMALLDVLLAIVIFVVGMLALASLQGNLTRSSADANVRTVGSNIAEELIEDLRTIESIHLAVGETCETDLLEITNQNIYQCIDDSTASLTRAGTEFNLAANVQDFYLMEDGVSVTTNVGDLPESWNVTASNYKFIELTVNWADNAVAFQGANADNPLLGSGSVNVSAIVPSIPNLGAAKIAAGQGDAASMPLVDYTPGARPDVIPINLDNDKFKESTKPKPEVKVRDSIVETWFDVVTYNQATDDQGIPTGSTYLRREEFAVVSCVCTLRDSAGGTGDGFLPTTWNGYSYTEGKWARKQYGESANNQQSQYCDVCCRDHHDSGNGNDDSMYDPFVEWTESDSNGNHKHWGRSKQGNQDGLVLATKDGDNYVEACRLVRKDGYMRVAQDFRQEQLIVVPQSYFNSESNVQAYSNYVTDSVAAFYPSRGTFADPPQLPGDDPFNAVALPTAVGASFDQQVSRAVYFDHITESAKIVIDCIKDGSAGSDCGAPGVDAGKYLQVVPFYEIQTTWLSIWNQVEPLATVSVSSDPLEDDNSHSRGLAKLTGSADYQAEIENTMHRGNVGLTATDPISPDSLHYVKGEESYLEYISPNGGAGTPPGGTTFAFTGTITSFANKPRAADVIMSGNGVVCSKNNTQFTCAIDKAEDLPTLIVTNYEATSGNTALPLWICETSKSYASAYVVQPGGSNTTTFYLEGVTSDTSDVELSIQDSKCP